MADTIQDIPQVCSPEGMIELQQFVAANVNSSPAELKLRLSGKKLGFDLDFALIQIAARKKTSKKLSAFVENPHFLFPSDIAAQQASDQLVARFHASLFTPPLRWTDLTAGLGIDAISAAQAGHNVSAIEIDSGKSGLLRRNASLFRTKTGKSLEFNVVCSDAEEWLRNRKSDSADVIFIDPARRDAYGKRLISLSDCLPDASALLPEMLRVAEVVLVKCSPMLDVSQTLRDLPYASDLFAIGVRGECKELLALCRRNLPEVRTFHAVDFDANGNSRQFSWNKAEASIPDRDFKSSPETISAESMKTSLAKGTETYLYEPSATMLKLHSDVPLMSRFGNLQKADANSHIFLSHTFYPEFPGKISRVRSVVGKKESAGLKGSSLAVVSRNYPTTSEEIRRRFRLGESDNDYLYAFRLGGKPIMLITIKVNIPNNQNIE